MPMASLIWLMGKLSLTQKLLGLFHAGVAEVITERIADLRGENFAEVGRGKACHAGEHFQGKIRICGKFLSMYSFAASAASSLPDLRSETLFDDAPEYRR